MDTLFFFAVDIQVVLLQPFFSQLYIPLGAVVDEILFIQCCSHGLVLSLSISFIIKPQDKHIIIILKSTVFYIFEFASEPLAVVRHNS